MPDQNGSALLPDLTSYSPEAEQFVYNFIAKQYFPAEPLDPIALDDDFIETRTAEQAELEIHYLRGRWFAAWKDASPLSGIERDVWEMISITIEAPRIKINAA